MKQILMVMYGSMGDVVNGSDVFKYIKQRHPDSHLTALISANTCSNPLTHNPFIDVNLNVSDIGNPFSNPDILKLQGKHFEIVYFFCHHGQPYEMLDTFTYDVLHIYYGGPDDYRKNIPTRFLERTTGVYPFDLGVFETCSYRTMYYYSNNDVDKVQQLIQKYDLENKKLCVFTPFSSTICRDIPLRLLNDIVRLLNNRYVVILNASFRYNLTRTAEWHKEFEKVAGEVICIVDREGDEQLGIGGLAALIDYSDVLLSSHHGVMCLGSSFTTPQIVICDGRWDRTKPFKKIPYINIWVDTMEDVHPGQIAEAFDYLHSHSKFDMTFNPKVYDYRKDKSRVRYS